jgi:catechol 2,3-dioxygenase-like lactoylglutathione lyase family enzyme
MAASLFRVVLPTHDMGRSDAFWSDLLEIPVDPVAPTRHYFPTGGAILAIVDPREHGHEATPNADCVYIRLPDLDAAYERALSRGAPMLKDYQEPGIARRPWGDRSFYTADPFGNPVCFIDDVGSDTTPATARYAGKPIANLCNVVLPTRRMGRSDAFFEALLGSEPDTFVPGRHTFHLDSCMLTLVDTVEHARGHELALPVFRPNVEITYFAVPDLMATWETARKLDLQPIDDHTGVGIQVRPWGERSFYGLDPSGNPVCFVDPDTLFTGSHSWKSV